MEYSKSICFSATRARELNEKAFLLNHSLYLFAYYEPKPYRDHESNRSKFITAIINLYGLFWDCGPFVFKLFRTKDSILLNDWSRIQNNANNLEKGISGFRSVFCHNCCDQFPLFEEKKEDAKYWASLYATIDQSIDDIPEESWGKLLDGLVKETDSLINDLDIALDTLRVTSDTCRQESAIDRWIKLIALEYRKNPDYLLNTISELYLLYLVNTKQLRDTSRDLRSLTTNWVSSFANTDRKTWFSKWLDATEPDGISNKDISNTKLYAILKDWPNQWAAWNNRSAVECDEAPMPASVYFHILASDVEQYARNPAVAQLKV